jgi:hypothetical protein
MSLWRYGLGLLVLTGCSAGHAQSGDEQDLQASVVCGLEPTAPASLRALLDAPVADAKDADTRFACLQSMLRTQKDRRAPFATLYSGITSAVRGAIANGRFEDGAWVDRYLTAFAELYRAAFVAYLDERRDDVPAAWRHAFDAAKGGQELVAQDLALGVNAHVDRDLAHALTMVGIGAEGKERDTREHDHLAVNDILNEQLEPSMRTIAELYAPGLGKTPEEVRQLIGRAFFDVLKVGRQKAWDHAVELTRGGLLARAVSAEVELSSAAIADAILAPELDPALIAVLRRLEEG